MPPTPGNKSHSRIASLDGLRGIAVLLVICWHSLPKSIFFPGWAGVDLFFVLSGYLITQRLLATNGNAHYLFNFYRNRALRIFPLYYAFVISFLLLIRLMVSARNLPYFEGYFVHWKSFFIFTQNWTFIRYPLPQNASLWPLWSVAVEMQFYVIWPFVILAMPSTRSRLIAFPILLAIIWITRIAYTFGFPADRHSIYYNSFFRMDGFLMGSLLCQLHEAKKKIANRRVIPVLLILPVIIVFAPIATGNTHISDPFFPIIGYPLLALFFTLVLHVALQPQNFLPFLSNKFLQLSGRISYCLYIIHIPLLIALGARLTFLGSSIWPQHPYLINSVVTLIVLLLTFAFSIFSYRYFESFFLRLKT